MTKYVLNYLYLLIYKIYYNTNTKMTLSIHKIQFSKMKSTADNDYCLYTITTSLHHDPDIN